ncbi:MAG: fibronectin type III domain-containing protein, partial [Gaiellales bacterium]
GKIEVISTATMTVTRTITLSGKFVSLVADPRGGYLIVSNNQDNPGPAYSSVDIVRIADGQLLGSVALGTNRGSYIYNQIAVSPDGRTAYAADWVGDDLFEVSLEDPTNPQLVSGTPTYVFYGRGVAVSPDGARVYVTVDRSPAKVTVITMATPGAPTGAEATAGVESATVTWSAPSSDGGAPVLSYTVTAVEDPAKSCTSTATLPAAPALTCTVSGLTAGSSYSFVVKARNGIGDGSASAASNAVVARARAAADSGSAASGSAAADSGSAATAGTRSTVRVVSAGQASRSVVLRVRVSGPGRVTVAGTVAPSKDGGARQRICSGTRAVKRAGTVLVTCRLNQTGRALLAASNLRVRLGVAYRPVEGAARTATRVVRLVQTGGQPEPVTG